MRRRFLIITLASILPWGLLGSWYYSSGSGTVLFSDDFNRANGAPGSNWLVDGSAFAILSNQISLSDSGLLFQTMKVATGAATFGADQGVRIEVGSIAASDAGFNKTLFIGLRIASDFSGGYMVGFNSDGYFAFDLADDSSYIDFTPTAFAGTDLPEARVIGTTITIWKNGTQIDSFVSSDYASGQPGLAMAVENSGTNGATTADNFVGTQY